MSIGDWIQDFGHHSVERHVGKLQEAVPEEWVEEALAATGTASVRTRRLPAELVVWLVVGMAMYRNMAIDAVVQHLGLSLGDSRRAVARSAISEARGKLGPKPLKWLLEKCAWAWWKDLAQQEHARWRGLNLLGMDGTMFRVADSAANRAEFGGHYNGKAESGYPLCRMVALFSLSSHLVLDAEIGAFSEGEVTLSKRLWEVVPDGSLVIVDRLYRAANLLVGLEKREQVHFLTRAPEKRNWRVVRVLGRGDSLVEVRIDGETRRKNPGLPPTWTFRVIEYQRKGRRGALCTSLLDPRSAPARELVKLYHQRWEIELAYDEVKTEMLQREETLRSQLPERVKQELWGLLLAFNLVRVEMARVALEAGVSPTRISFVGAYQRLQLLWVTLAAFAPGKIPEELRRARADIRRLILPERKPGRSYPRSVKTQPRKYPKRPT